jgi:hypothetical protein
MQTFVGDHLHVRWTRRHETTDWPPGSTAYIEIPTFPPPVSQNTDEIKATIRGAC